MLKKRSILSNYLNQHLIFSQSDTYNRTTIADCWLIRGFLGRRGVEIVYSIYRGGISLGEHISHRLELLSANSQGKLSHRQKRKNTHAQTEDWSFHALLPKRTIRQDGQTLKQG